MSNVLFINLKRNGDIFNTAALAQSYMKEHPHAMPYLLVYDEFSKATKPLSIFNGVFSINRKKLTTFTNNDLYSNGFALDELLEEFQSLESITWSEIVNYSSDKASTFLSNYLAADKNIPVTGVKFGAGNLINYESNWEIIFNEVLTQEKLSSVHFSTAYHGMANVKEFNGPYNLKRIAKHDETVISNFNTLRKNNSAKGLDCSLIGIQLFSSMAEKDWSKEQISTLLESMLDEPTLYPILLTAPTEEERNFSKEINAKFDNRLVVIESDFLALSSVLSGLDILVTPDTSVKHLADLNSCKIIECTKRLDLSMKQGTKGVGNLIIDLKENFDSQIIDSCKFMMNPNESTLSAIESDNIYITYMDNLGWNVKPITGSFNPSFFKRQLRRSYICKWSVGEYKWDIKTYFSDYNYSVVQNLIDEEKNQISEISKDLLGTLRSLVKASESPNDAKSFVVSLDRLLNHSDANMMSSIPVIEFKALLENLNAETTEKQFRAVEDLLYRLKKNLQLALECLNNVEKDARSMPKKNKGNMAELSIYKI